MVVVCCLCMVILVCAKNEKLMNLVQIYFGLSSSAIILYGVIINLFEHHLPDFFSQLFRYGKFSAKNANSKLVIEVPKSTFKHFYVTAVIVYLYVLYLVTSVYVFERPVPDWLIGFLNLVCGSDRVAYTPVIRVYLATVLLSVQVFRRFYDTHFVSVFGQSSKINISHYVIGMVYYPGTALALLCEAPLFARTPSTIVTDDHTLPEGDWFKYLSAPHQTAEILMYTSLMIILWHNITWFFVFAWVVSNQTETILLSHWWYQEKFENFPKNRKAMIPFVY